MDKKKGASEIETRYIFIPEFYSQIQIKILLSFTNICLVHTAFETDKNIGKFAHVDWGNVRPGNGSAVGWLVMVEGT